MNAQELKRRLVTLFVPMCLVSMALGQQSASAPAWSPAQSIGVFAFGRNGQNQDQQVKDESECYGTAKQSTGFDPQKRGAATAPTVEQVEAAQNEAAQKTAQGKAGAVKGAAGGAAGGAAIGAITGSAGKGAAIGAVAGTMAGGAAQRSANAQAQQKAAAQAKAKVQKEHEEQMMAHEEGLDTFQRAFAACMDARGYSVK
jgi:outer membrane lipoprotein SlyB